MMIDYTDPGWGHAVGQMLGDDEKGHRWAGHGFRPDGRRIVAGDVLLVRMQSGKVGRWVVEEIEYYRDPRDMWAATVRRDGYEEARDARV